MMSWTFGLFTQVSGLGPLGPLVCSHSRERKTLSYSRINTVNICAMVEWLEQLGYGAESRRIA